MLCALEEYEEDVGGPELLVVGLHVQFVVGLPDLDPHVPPRDPEHHPCEPVRVHPQDRPRNEVQEELALGVSPHLVRLLEHFQVQLLHHPALQQTHVLLEDQAVVLELLFDGRVLLLDFKLNVLQKRVL